MQDNARHEEGPEILERVAKYRAAAQVAVRSDRPLKARLLAVLDLADAARAEEGSTVRAWTSRAVYEEVRPLLEDAPANPAVVLDPLERSARSLRAKGYSACPSCRQSLPDEVDFVRWASLRQVWLDEQLAREGAVA